MLRNIYVTLTALAILTTIGVAIEEYGVEGEDYIPGEVIVKFTKPVKTISMDLDGICRTGVPQIDALNKEYGVYEMVQLCPEPSEWDFDNGDGKWDFVDFYSKWEDSGIGNIYKLSYGVDAGISEVVSAYDNTNEIEYAAVSGIAYPDFVPNDEHYPRQYYLHNNKDYGIKAESAWEESRGNITIKVAVIDSGIKYNHEDIQLRLLRGYNYVDRNWDPYDRHGHGTPVTGIIAANTDNTKGVAGIDSYCKIIPMKVSDTGIFPNSNTVSAIYDSCRLGAHIINMSFSLSHNHPYFEEAVAFANDVGRLMIASSGNKGHTSNPSVRYPAAYNEVIAVGSTNILSGNRKYSSSYGHKLELVAPTSNFTLSTEYSAVYDGFYEPFTGTSASAPVVAGVAALVWGKHTNWTSSMVRKKIQGSVTTPGHGLTGWHPETGWGIINAAKAVDYVSSSITKSDSDGNGLPPKGNETKELAKIAELTNDIIDKTIISPNPIQDDVNIAFISPGGGYQVTIYDISGRKVKEWSGNATGEVSLHWNTAESNAGSGIYLLKTEIDGQINVRKMVISR